MKELNIKIKEQHNSKPNKQILNSEQCITKCQKNDNVTPHPYTLINYKDVKNSDYYCHTNPYITKTNIKYNRACKPDEEININNDVEHYFGIDLNNKIILSCCYNIKTLPDGINWIYSNILNKTKPNKTIIRVINMIWECFIDEIRNSTEFCDLYFKILKYKIEHNKIFDNIAIIHDMFIIFNNENKFKRFDFHKLFLNLFS